MYRDFSAKTPVVVQEYLGLFVEIFAGVEVVMSRYRAGNLDFKDAKDIVTLGDVLKRLGDTELPNHDCFANIALLTYGEKFPTEIREGVAEWLKQNGHVGRE